MFYCITWFRLPADRSSSAEIAIACDEDSPLLVGNPKQLDIWSLRQAKLSDPKEAAEIANGVAAAYLRHSAARLPGIDARIIDVAVPGLRPVRPNQPLDLVLGGWQLGGIFSAHTGFPLTIKVTGDPSGTGTRSERANVIGTPHDPHKLGPNQPFLDSKAYSVPGPRTFGNSGVGIVRGPGMTRLDLSVNKQFRVTERKYIQLRLAAFNATNTPIFQAPASLVITAPTFGQIRPATAVFWNTLDEAIYTITSVFRQVVHRIPTMTSRG